MPGQLQHNPALKGAHNRLNAHLQIVCESFCWLTLIAASSVAVPSVARQTVGLPDGSLAIDCRSGPNASRDALSPVCTFVHSLVRVQDCAGLHMLVRVRADFLPGRIVPRGKWPPGASRAQASAMSSVAAQASVQVFFARDMTSGQLVGKPVLRSRALRHHGDI